MENNKAFIKKYISKHRAKHFILQETKESNLFDKSCTKENVFNIQREGSWIRWIVIEQVYNKQYYFPLKEIVLIHF